MNAILNQGILVERTRVSSIDIARGLVMIVMALDHSRHFFDGDSLVYEPTDLSRTTPFLFFTRWITHFCAPSFVFLAGTAIRLTAEKRTGKELSMFLLTRGLWLVFAEVVIIRFLIAFNFYFDFIMFQVIYAIGAAMILMALVIRLKESIVLALSLVIIFSHNLFQGVAVGPESPLYIPVKLLIEPGPISLGPDSTLMVGYPVLPWLGIMMLGYVIGKWFTREYDTVRSTYLLITGLMMLLLFVVMRYFNLYGDPNDWTVQKDFTFTVMSFLNCEKYPPSLLFTLMTLGPLLIVLSILDKVNARGLRPVEVFGRVPMFYYILHFLLLHLAGLGYYLWKTGKSFSDLDFHSNASFGGINPDVGHALLAVYAGWIGVVLLLYPIRKWYNDFKRGQRRWWFSYV